MNFLMLFHTAIFKIANSFLFRLLMTVTLIFTVAYLLAATFLYFDAPTKVCINPRYTEQVVARRIGPPTTMKVLECDEWREIK